MVGIPRTAFYQFLIVALAGAFALAYEIRAEEFAVEIWLEELIISFLVILFLMALTYIVQAKLAVRRGGKIRYEFWGWGLVVTVFASLISTGKFPYFMPGYMQTDTAVSRVGHKKPVLGRVETAALAGVGPTLALLLAFVFFENRIIADATIAFAAWSLLPIPFTNGFHYFNWNPINGGLMAVVGLFLYISHFFNGAGVVPFIVLLFFIPYQWIYVYTLARRQSY